MEITEVKIIPKENAHLKAFVNVVFDNCFVVRGMKIIDGHKGLFISMPNKQLPNGQNRDIAHPINNKTRLKIKDAILKAYNKYLED